MAGRIPFPTTIFHITHVRNLPRIIAAGGLHAVRSARRHALQFVNIGNLAIKDDRDHIPVPGYPGTTLGDFVPFYFAPRSQMLYMIANGHVEGYAEGEDPVVYRCARAQDVAARALPFVFTDRHARVATARFMNDLSDLGAIDWRLMTSRYWYATDADPDRKPRRQAEFLVQRFVPWDLVVSVATKTEAVRDAVRGAIAGAQHRPDDRVEPSWYYRAQE